MNDQLFNDDIGLNQKRVWQLLQELRRRESNELVKEDIRILKRVLHNLIFEQPNCKNLSNSLTGQTNRTSPTCQTGSPSLKIHKVKISVDSALKSNPKFHNLLKYLETTLLPHVKSTEKLVFVEQQAQEIRGLVVKPDESGKRLIIIGPEDIKTKSAGRIRIGDQILAINQHFLHSLSSTEKSQTQSNLSNAFTNETIGNRRLKQRKRERRSTTALDLSLAQRDDDTCEVPGQITIWKSDIENVAAVSWSSLPSSSSSSSLSSSVFPTLVDRYENLIENTGDEEVCKELENYSTIIVTLLRQSPHMVLRSDWTQVEIIHLPNIPGVGLGFSIVGSTSSGVIVKTILPGSVAAKDKRLCPGDHILKIRGVSVHGMNLQQIAMLLRRQDVMVELVVGRPALYSDRSKDTESCWTMPTRDVLCRESFEEQIRKHSVLMPSGSNLLDVEGCENLNNNKNNKNNNNDDIATTINKSISIPVKDPGPSQTVSAVIELTDSRQMQDDGTEPKNNEGICSTKRNESISKVPSKTFASETSSTRSLRELQEMALTIFLRENWIPHKYETIEVELCRDPVLGLGITIAGYVHKKEEISGVFVKSLVPNSSAFHSRKIQLNDLILEVNDKSLEGLNHSESIRTLLGSGTRVKIKLIRFLPDSPQAECLTMLQRQEAAATQMMDVQNTLRDVVADWKHRLGSDFEVISVDLIPDNCEDGGLGISLEGTVDILNGTQLCPHHYIDSLRPGGPAAFSNALRSGDELLQANDVVLYGESHVTVRQALSKAASTSQRVRLTVARKVQTVNVFMPRPEEGLPIAYPLLAVTDDRLVKAKSDTCITKFLDSTIAVLEQVSRRLRSRSLQLFNGLAIWRCVPTIVQLMKDSRGLGFSIVDYQDPLHPEQSVIVVRSLVPGGLAQADGRIIPGDRLMFVNDEDLSNSTLEHAVAVLKSTPDGLVRLGIAKPIPIEEFGNGLNGHSPLISRSERVLAKGSSPRSRRRHRKQIASYTSSQETVWLGAFEYRRQQLQSNYQSSGSITPSTPRTCNISLNGSYLSMSSWSPCSTRSLSPCGSPLRLRGTWAYDIIYLPPSLERSIKIQKGPLSLGIVLNSEIDKGINGCQVKSICSKKAVGLDGRVQVNDYIVKVNMESLRNVTNSQARAILKRTNLIGTQCNITYITAADAKIWKEKYHHETDYQLPTVNRLSPKIFPKYYHSSCLDKKQMAGVEQSQDICDSNLLDSKISKSSATSSLTKKQLNCALIDGKIIDEFVYNLMQTLLKDVWQELLASEFLSKGAKFDLSEKERQPSLSASIETTPSTSVVVQEDKSQPVSSTGKLDSSKNICRKVKNMMDKLKTSNSEETQKLSQSGIPTLSEQSNLERTVSEAEQIIIQDEIRQNSIAEAILINPSMSTNFPDSLPSSLSSEKSTSPKSNRFWGQPRTVILDRKPNQSFGISIVGGRVEVSNKSGQSGAKSTVSGIFIKSVLPNSPAGLSNMMHMGDRVISVNDQDLREATHEEAVQVIKNAKNPVKFVVQSLQSFPQFESDISEEKDENRDENEKNMSKLRKETECDNSSLTNTINAPEVPTKSDIISTLSEESDIHLRELIAAETDARKESFTSVTPKIDLQKRIKFKFGEMKTPKTAEIIEKPLIDTDEKKLEEMQTLEKLLRKRGKERGESRSTDDARRRAIDPCSAAALPKRDDDPEEEDLFFYTKDKINRKYGNLMGETMLLKLDKVPHSGLGLSLASNREHDRTIILVVAVKPTCPLSVKIGDELLEVNGKVLTGLSHLNVSSIMRQCCEHGILELLLLRRFEALAIVLESDGSNTIGNEAEMSNNSETNVQHPVEDVTKKSSLQNESVAEIEPGCETLIEIDKVGKGLGLSIVGGSDTVLGTVVIHEVYPDGAAAIDGRLKPGDQVLEVNGISLRGVSHEQAILLLRRTPAKVSLLIYRDVNLQLSLLDPTQIYNIFEMELTKKPGRGLGLSIVGRKNEPGVYVSEVVKGGSADADGRLIQGDQILAVNGQDVTNAMQEDVATKLKACTGRVVLKVGRWKLTEAANKKPTTTEGASSSSEQQHSGGTAEKMKMLKTPEIKLYAPNSDDNAITIIPDDHPFPVSMSISKSSFSKSEENQPSQVVQADLSSVIEESSSGADQKSSVADEESLSAVSLDQNKEVELIRELKEENSDSLLVLLNKIPDQQLGMGIGRRSRGILVTSLQPGSIAAEKLKVGDRLMAVNGVAITDQLSAVALVKASDAKLWLQISRPRTSENS